MKRRGFLRSMLAAPAVAAVVSEALVAEAAVPVVAKAATIVGGDDLVLGGGSGQKGITIFSKESDPPHVWFDEDGGFHYDHATDTLHMKTPDGQDSMDLGQNSERWNTIWIGEEES